MVDSAAVAARSAEAVQEAAGNMDRLETLLQYHQEDPDDRFMRFAVASEYRKRGDLETALTWFEGLLEMDASYVGTYYHLGKLYEELNRKEDAIKTYRTGITTAGDQSDFHARSELQSALLEAEGLGFD